MKFGFSRFVRSYLIVEKISPSLFQPGKKMLFYVEKISQGNGSPFVSFSMLNFFPFDG